MIPPITSGVKPLGIGLGTSRALAAPKRKTPASKLGPRDCCPRTSGERSSPTPLVQIFERKMTFVRGRRRPAPGLGGQARPPSEPAGPGGQFRSLSMGANLFAADKA